MCAIISVVVETQGQKVGEGVGWFKKFFDC